MHGLATGRTGEWWTNAPASSSTAWEVTSVFHTDYGSTRHGFLSIPASLHGSATRLADTMSQVNKLHRDPYPPRHCDCLQPGHTVWTGKLPRSQIQKPPPKASHHHPSSCSQGPYFRTFKLEFLFSPSARKHTPSSRRWFSSRLARKRENPTDMIAFVMEHDISKD